MSTGLGLPPSWNAKTKEQNLETKGLPNISRQPLLFYSYIARRTNWLLKLCACDVTIICCGPLAQVVEHRPFKAVVGGSSPPRLTKYFWSDAAV